MEECAGSVPAREVRSPRGCSGPEGRHSLCRGWQAPVTAPNQAKARRAGTKDFWAARSGRTVSALRAWQLLLSSLRGFTPNATYFSVNRVGELGLWYWISEAIFEIWLSFGGAHGQGGGSSVALCD
ncbi:hypothetical protein UC8_50650 [Roseimaritima ulvae]|uniref:Uncharacterized protein n=1 Tax=Roseimaritima ulvae TaxID=980254 RepID=A0A5B9QYC0_9BACT|nr:hypothetical protein UC8_50650 [Roseimaritima ulvae]